MASKGKKKKSTNKPEPEEVVVLSIADQFGDFFSIVQVKDTLIANNLDIDKTLLSLRLKHDKAVSLGKTQNIKKTVYDKV